MKYVKKMKNNIFIIAFILLFSIILIPNTGMADSSNRIISLIPSSTEMIFAIGFGDEVIGVSNYCNYPTKEIEKLPRIGDQNLSIEKIISLRPTHLIDTNSIHKRYEAIFKKLNLNYINISMKEMDDIPKEASRLDEILGDKNRADKFIENWNLEISKMKSKTKENGNNIYVEIWNNPIQAVGGNNIINSIIIAAGGKNVLEKHNDYPVVNTEIIMIANPDIIILAYPDANVESIKNRPGWKNLKAVKSNKITAIDQDTIVRPGPRNLEAIKFINNYINKVENNEKN